MRKGIKFILKVLFTIFLFYLIFRKIDIGRFFEIIYGANFWYLILVCLLWPISVFVSSYKWNLILKCYGIDLSQGKTFDLYWIGTFFNNFLPTSFGGDSYKFIYLNKKVKNKKAQIVSSIILERGIGFFIIFIFILIFGFFAVGDLLMLNNIFYICLLISALVVISLFLILTFQRRLLIKKVFKFKIINKLIKGYNILISFSNRRILVISLITSTLFLIISIFSHYLVFRAFSTQVPFIVLAFLMPLVSLMGLVPFTINSLGIKEGVGIYLYSLFGINAEVTLSVLLVIRIILLICTSTGGLRYLVGNNEFRSKIKGNEKIKN